MHIAQIGEIVPCMTQNFEHGFERAIAKYKHRREPYYLLYTADWYSQGSELRDVFRAFGRKPPRLLNSMCWLINNKTGECKQMWVLPKDAPIQEGIQFEALPDETILKSADGIPIIYGGN